MARRNTKRPRTTTEQHGSAEPDEPADDGVFDDGDAANDDEQGEMTTKEQLQDALGIPVYSNSFYVSNSDAMKERSPIINGESKLDEIIVQRVDLARLVVLATLAFIMTPNGTAEWPLIMARRLHTEMPVVFPNEPREDDKPRPVKPKLMPSMYKLREWGILEKASGDRRKRSFVKYCEVPKTSTTNRAIMDSRVTNAQALKPPKFFMANPNELKQMLMFFRTPFVGQSDMRHMYHAAKLPASVRDWFSLLVKNTLGKLEIWRSVTLCMGFSWSCVLSESWSMTQATSFTGKGTDPFTFETTVAKDMVPGYIIVRERKTNVIVAFIIVVYDNYVCIARDADTRRSLCRRYKANALSMEQQFKQLDKSLPLDLLAEVGEDNCFEFMGNDGGKFLGIHYRRGVDADTLDVRHADPSRWEDIRTSGGATVPARKLARFCGVATWNTTLRGIALCEISSVIHMVKRQRIEQRERKWASDVTLTTTEMAEWARVMDDILRNEWLTVDAAAVPVERHALLSSDASNSALGGVWLSDDGAVIRRMFREFTDEEKATPIYVRECIASKETIEWFFDIQAKDSTLPEELKHFKGIKMAIDNIAAKICYERWWSGRDEVNKLIVPLKTWLDANGIDLISIWMPTAIQASDNASRLKDDDPEICRQCAEYLTAHTPLVHVLQAEKARELERRDTSATADVAAWS
jgi:hypothetical protein